MISSTLLFTILLFSRFHSGILLILSFSEPFARNKNREFFVNKNRPLLLRQNLTTKQPLIIVSSPSSLTYAIYVAQCTKKEINETGLKCSKFMVRLMISVIKSTENR